MRLYSNIATDTVLTADPGAGGTTLALVSVSGWPVPSSGDTALACIEIGTSAVELVEYTGVSGTSLTGCTRGVDGTTAASHTVGVSVRHVASAADVQGFVRYGDNGLSALQAGQWYAAPGVLSVGTGTLTAGVLRDVQFHVPVRTRFLGIGIEVTTAGTAGALLRFGIYRSLGNARPGALFLSAGTVAATSLGFKSVTIDTWMPRGLYHLAVVPEVANVGTRITGSYGARAPLPMISTTSTSVAVGYSVSVSAGSVPDPFPTSGLTLQANQPYILLLTA